VTLEKCTLLNNKPHGLAQIKFIDDSNKYQSFTGVGFFNQGVLDGGSLICHNAEGYTFSFSLMMNGLPADGSYMTFFKPTSQD